MLMFIFGRKVTEITLTTVYRDPAVFEQEVNKLAKNGEKFEIGIEENFCYIDGKIGTRYTITRPVKSYI